MRGKSSSRIPVRRLVWSFMSNSGDLKEGCTVGMEKKNSFER